MWEKILTNDQIEQKVSLALTIDDTRVRLDHRSSLPLTTMSLSPPASTAARSTLKQASDVIVHPSLERVLDNVMLDNLRKAYAESWVTEPAQALEEDQLQKLFRTIVTSPMAGYPLKEWMDQVKEEDALARAQVAEPTIKQCLQECWTMSDFSVIRNAGQ